MDKKVLQNVTLINIMNCGNAIIDSVLFQMKNGEFNENTFRNWIMAIEHQLDKLNDEDTDNGE